MGIGRRPLGRLRRLTPNEDTHRKGFLANRSVPRGILQAAVPFSYKFGGKHAVLAGRFHAPSFSAWLHARRCSDTSNPVYFRSRTLLAAPAINVSRITPDETAPNLHILEIACVPQCPPTSVLLLTQYFAKAQSPLPLFVCQHTYPHSTAV